MVIKLISNDNIAVEFGKDEIHRIPYITDIIDSVDADYDIPVVCVNSKPLKIVKELLELQTKIGVPYKCLPIETHKLGVIIKTSPIHTLDPWEGKMPRGDGKSQYMVLFDSLSSKDCLDAFCAADYLKCYDLRYGLGYIIARLQLAYDSEMHALIKERFSEHLMGVYVNVVLNED
jgi:hypothetical protein